MNAKVHKSTQTQLVFSGLSSLKENIRSLKGDQLLVVVDQMVWELYQHSLKKVLSDRNYEVCLVGPGERAKDFTTLHKTLESLLEKSPSKNSHLLAIGGGATSDLAGLVAALLLRGISWSIIPTTLLSMLDAGVGGKVAINSNWGKNLIGTFHFPSKVYICPEFLKTLPVSELRSGKGELLKYALLSKEIGQKVQDREDLSQFVQDCLKYKLELVENDPYDQGTRKFLNLGHTLGHVLEPLLELSHGEAVALGIFVILQSFSDNQKLKETFQDLLTLLDLQLDPHYFKQPRFSKEAFWRGVFKDKKKLDQEHIELVLLKNIGEPYLQKMKFQELIHKVEEKWVI